MGEVEFFDKMHKANKFLNNHQRKLLWDIMLELEPIKVFTQYKEEERSK